MNDLIFIGMLCTSGLINLSSFDDALIDLLAFGIARASLATRRAVSATRLVLSDVSEGERARSVVSRPHR